MLDLKNDLILQINHYLDNELSRNELSIWAKKIKKKLLKDNNLIFIDNNLLYPFILELALSPDELESCDLEIIKKFSSIMQGKERYRYFWLMKLPEKKEKSIIEITNILNYFDEKGVMEDEHIMIIEELKKKRNKFDSNSTTFYDIISNTIMEMIFTLPFKKDLELDINSCYLDIETIGVDKIISKIRDYIKCFTGEKEFAVNVDMYGEKKIITICIM